ncbi:MAG: DUF1592 domain-containing protein [Planctomycetota bacterium]|nr:DUF1592 domain-containing protein [Planctomycetota bacterium]
MIQVAAAQFRWNHVEATSRVRVLNIETWVLSLVCYLLMACCDFSIVADEPTEFSRVAPIFKKHCHGCHGPTKSKGDLRLDTLNPDLVAGNDADQWREVLDRLNFGDMPPKTEPPLAMKDRESLTQWLVQERRRADRAKNPTTHFRRLTRREYERSMQDLLGLDIAFGSRLPEDGRTREGFRNNGEMLRMSPLQYEMYLQIADEALAKAIVSGPPPVVHRYRLKRGDQPNSLHVTSLPKPENRAGASFDYEKEKRPAFRIWNKSDEKKESDGILPPSAIRRFSEAAVKPPEHCLAIGFHAAFRTGEALVRIRAARVDTPANKEAKSRVPLLTVAFGCTNLHGVELTTVGEPLVIDHADFRTHEVRVRMESMPIPNISPPSDRNAAILAVWNSAKTIKGDADPPRLKIEWIELETPFLETWPPSTHTNILFPNDRDLAESEYVREVIGRFATRAYRRPLVSSELDRLMRYWSETRKNSDSLEASLRDTLGVVLSSPQFLGLVASRSTPDGRQQLNDYELAARLSYFLWSSMPDEPLVKLAETSQLQSPHVLAAQTRRMIRDPRAWEFIAQFTEQWLELDRLQRVTVDRGQYPSFNEELSAAMRMESLHFFGDVLRSEATLFQILDSDFTYLNESLAEHYGITGVNGPQFRRVSLDESHHRGGVLTHASVLTGTSDGHDGHPIKRGMWLLGNLLDQRPPPPPPNVPELDRADPKVRGLTIPQALAVHRESTACMGCHRKIDPWGLAFEEYDAIGNWQRDGIGAELRRRRTQHPVESRTELPGGVEVNGMKQLQAELLRTRKDDFRRTLLRKMMAYALGRSLTLADLEAADSLAATLRDRGDRMGTLVELIVASEVFQSK